MYLKAAAKCCSCGEKSHNYRACIKWKEGKPAFANRVPVGRSTGYSVTRHPAAPNAKQVGPSSDQGSMGPGWNNVV